MRFKNDRQRKAVMSQLNSRSNASNIKNSKAPQLKRTKENNYKNNVTIEETYVPRGSGNNPQGGQRDKKYKIKEWGYIFNTKEEAENYVNKNELRNGQIVKRIKESDKEKIKEYKQNPTYSKAQQDKINRINKNAKKSEPNAVRELQLYAESDGQLYRSMEVPIQKNLSKRWKKGTYDKEGGKLAWYNWSTQAEKNYSKEFGSSGMSVADRSQLAITKEKEWREEMESGNFTE